MPIQAATLDLLVPPLGTHGIDCVNTPSECIVVATANTDDNGNFPLPGIISPPAPFNIVPLGTYALLVTASGYDPVTATAPVNGVAASAICGSPNISTTNCSFALTSSAIGGNVSIDVPPAAGTNVQVLVTAEDGGTNKLENVTMVTIPAGATSAHYLLLVPSAPSSFDLFAAAQDFYNGAPSRFPGHTIQVLSGVRGGDSNDFAALSCVGHASLTGSVAVTPDSGTTVRLSKDDVQLMESQVGPNMTPNGGLFSFCAPPDTYTLQRYENGAPQATATTVTLAAPSPTSTPCPSICGSASSCPGVCSNTALDRPL